jgi:hypothetical protein
MPANAYERQAAAAIDAWEIEVPADAAANRRFFDASPHEAGEYLGSVIGDHTARVLVCRRGSETFEPPTADELAPVYVAAGFTESQGRAIEESVANIAASDEVDLRGMRRLKDGDEFGGFPAGAAIVEFAYRYRDDDRPDARSRGDGLRGRRGRDRLSGLRMMDRPLPAAVPGANLSRSRLWQGSPP